MDFISILEGFINEQVFGLAILILGLGVILSKYAKVDKKKMPIIFVLIAMPISVLYNILLSPELQVFVSAMNGVYQSMFSICISMGLYDIAKPLIRAIKGMFKKSIPEEYVDEEDKQPEIELKEYDPAEQKICECCGQVIQEDHKYGKI